MYSSGAGVDEAAQARRVHPTNAFVPFRLEDIEQSIPARFEQQVRQYPDRLAAKTRSEEIRYGALNAAANRVARAILEQRGEGSEPITVLLGLGPALIAAILGVLKAGKFYVPLNPSFPPARHAHILADSQAGCLLTDDRHLPLGRELAGSQRQVLNIERLDAGLSDENPGLSISPDALANIVYTSGSTGEPKGVVQNHRNILHFVLARTNSIHICKDDRVFIPGVSVRDIFAMLLNGAAIYQIDAATDGLVGIADWLIQQEITIFGSIPSGFRDFIGTLTGEEKWPRLRLITQGGEPVLSTDVELFRKHFSPECLFLNELGATEIIPICHYFVDQTTSLPTGTVPIGFPVADTEVLLLDEDGREAGLNCTGEIAVKSRYLALGYWRKPDLTRAAFLPDPEGSDARIYRTGDMGIRQPDGCLVSLGRKDHQVKIRGYRVEVAEVEVALLDLGSIKETVVVVREYQPGDQRLVAYIVPAGPPVPTASALRRALAQTLPEYMLPAVFVTLPAMPLTPNGKVDRQALPAPDGARPDLDIPFVAPRTPVEETLAAIWAEILGLDAVGIDDSFFELGGHSLLAAQVLARVRNAFRVELPLPRFFETPSLAGLAVAILQSRADRAEHEERAVLLDELESISEEEAQLRLNDETP